MEKWLMIVNPASASSTNQGKWKECVELLAEGGLEIVQKMTQKPSHAIDLAREAAGEGFRKFIAVGGDGTIHEVMTGLLRFAEAAGVDMGEFTLAVLPYGTGNDWIRTSLVPSDITEAAGCILRGKVAREDVVRLSFDGGVFCMANVCGVGMDADICYFTNKLKRKGHRGGILYKLVAPYCILTKKRRQVRVECDGECVYEGRLFSAVIGNGIYRGGGVRQNEDGGCWSDGVLELSVMGGVSHVRAFFLMIHALKGDFPQQKGIVSRLLFRLSTDIVPYQHTRFPES